MVHHESVVWILNGSRPLLLQSGKTGAHRAKELSGFRNWLERFGSWMSLIHDQYGAEMREAIRLQHPVVLVGEEQSMRARRLFHLLQQSFAGYNRVESMIRNQIAHRGVHEGNGFELLRLIRREFSLFSRTEALYYREQCLQFRAKPTTGQTLIDVLREVGSEIESFHGMLESSLVRDMIQDLRISEGDQFLLYLRNLPEKVREWVQPSFWRHQCDAALACCQSILHSHACSRRYGEGQAGD